MKKYRFKFADEITLPKRSYGQNLYKNYIDYLLGKKRDDDFCCHCFAIFNDELLQKIKEIIRDDNSCLCEPITINDLEEIN